MGARAHVVGREDRLSRRRAGDDDVGGARGLRDGGRATTPPTSEAARAARARSRPQNTDLAQPGPRTAARSTCLRAWSAGADRSHDLHALGRQAIARRPRPAAPVRWSVTNPPSSRNATGEPCPGHRRRPPARRAPADPRRRIRSTPSRRRPARRPGDPRFARSRHPASGTSRVDHARDLGAGRSMYATKRGLDRVDAGRHRKRRAHVVVPQDPNARGHRCGSVACGSPRVNPAGLGGSTPLALASPHDAHRSVRDGAVPVRATGTSSTTTFRNRRHPADDPRTARPGRRCRSSSSSRPSGTRCPRVRYETRANIARVVSGVLAGERHPDERRVRIRTCSRSAVAPGTLATGSRSCSPTTARGSAWVRSSATASTYLQAEAPRRTLVPGRRGARPGRRQANLGDHALQPEQPDRRRADGGRDAGRDRRRGACAARGCVADEDLPRRGAGHRCRLTGPSGAATTR